MGLLRAASGEVDLSSRKGDWLAGFAARVQPATGINDPLIVRALVMSDGNTELAILSFDLLGLHRNSVVEIQSQIETACGVPAGSILVSSTHTHSAPATMPLRGLMGIVNSDWLAEIISKAVDLVAGLHSQLELAELAFGSAQVTGVGINRQDEHQPFDEECAAIAVDTLGGRSIATILNYAVHPVILGPSNLGISADYPGVATRELQRLRGGVGLFLLGGCGDVDPVVYRDKGWGTGTFDVARETGVRLAQAAVCALEAAERTMEVTLSVESASVEMPLDPPLSIEEVARAEEQFRRIISGDQADCRDMDEKTGVLGWIRELLGALAASGVSGTVQSEVEQETAKAMLGWVLDLKSAISSNSVPSSMQCEIMVVGLNDIRIVAIPFEAYGELSLRIKAALSPLRTILAGYSNGLYGYVPTRRAKDQGGYGPQFSNTWFPDALTAFGYGADDLLVSESLHLASSLHLRPNSMLQED